MKLHLQAALRRGGPETRQPLEECVLITDQALDQVRNLSLNLRPSQLDDLGLVAALRWQIGRQTAASGLIAEFDADELNERLEPALETACFRFVQEATTNIVRHAQARHAWIEARRHNDRLRVERAMTARVSRSLPLPEAMAREPGGLGMPERVSSPWGSSTSALSPGEGRAVRGGRSPSVGPAGERWARGRGDTATGGLLVGSRRWSAPGIRSLVDGMEGFTVIGEASDGREALGLTRSQQPDVVLMDIAMKDLNGLETTVQIKRDFPGTRVVILSMHGTGDYVQQAIRAGASAYLMKDAATAELGIALQAVMRGEVYLSPAVSKQVVESYVLRPGSSDKHQAEQLTPRQREVLQMIAEGLWTKEIAYRMGVSVKTVETHRTQLMERLEIRDVAGLVRYAIRIGLITAEK